MERYTLLAQVGTCIIVLFSLLVVEIRKLAQNEMFCCICFALKKDFSKSIKLKPAKSELSFVTTNKSHLKVHVVVCSLPT